MKPLALLSLAAALPVALAGCADQSPTRSDVNDPLLKTVAEMGFDVTGAIDGGDHFLVEGDIILRKADLRGAALQREKLPQGADSGGPRFQYHTTRRVSSVYYHDLRVDYSAVESQDAAWASAIEQAMAAWNAIPGSKVHLAKWESGQFYGPHISIAFGSCTGSTVIACATFPTYYSEPGPTITIQQRSHPEKVSTIAHEIGHTLGLRHTNWNNKTCYDSNNRPYSCNETAGSLGAIHIPNTPISVAGGPSADPYSVMNWKITTWAGFSYYDRVAARYLFPLGAGPTPTVTQENSSNRISWLAMLDATRYEVYWHEEQPCPDIFCYGPIKASKVYVGTTPGTTFTDSSGRDPSCGVLRGRGYVVEALFPEGTRSGANALGCVSTHW